MALPIPPAAPVTTATLCVSVLADCSRLAFLHPTSDLKGVGIASRWDESLPFSIRRCPAPRAFLAAVAI
jgi:hypothetical protein